MRAARLTSTSIFQFIGDLQAMLERKGLAPEAADRAVLDLLEQLSVADTESVAG